MNSDPIHPDSEESQPLPSDSQEGPRMEKKPVPAPDSDLIDYSSDPEQEWRVYQNNSKSLSDAWNSDQERYAQLCHAAVEQSLQKLKTEPMSVKSLYEFLAEQRHAIALQLNQPSKKRVGIMRAYDEPGNPSTPVLPNGKYQDFFPEVKERIRALYNKEPQAQDGYVIQKDTNKGNFRRGDWVVIKDGDLPLTGITYPKEPLPHMMGFDPSFNFLHTEAQYIPKVYEKIDRLFHSVLEHPEPTKENMQKIGEMVWYLAHAMPCDRGSAATTELFARTMMKKIGLPVIPYEHPIPLDFEALIEPDKTKFIERFTRDFYPKLNQYYALTSEQETSQDVKQSTGLSLSNTSLFKNFKQELNKIVKTAGDVLENWNSPKNR
ncbi:type III effector AvrB4-1 [Fluoribacter gormanii]|uniref:Avirulence protein n=1 Tax=Fluoribacter gormanii TaxID=464 RepID=A0A377GN39_9GAMM|nr:type III effector AvrB4-1 [Fluoribacter gormanii]KTD04778.1 Avirulence protein [Fluoribacter gormanii]SIR16761.1 Avirulence protein [Fluoribacter gormanii]STO26220.1 Avirulence protein [Fluoribacter gormanii]